MPESYVPQAEFVEYAKAVRDMRRKQAAFFKDEGTIGEAITAERKVDRWTEELLNPKDSLFSASRQS